MPGSTPNLGLPYPLETDPLSGGSAEIQSLATMLDGMLAGAPWVTATILPGHPTGSIKYCRDGAGNVHVNGSVQRDSGSMTPAITLPPGFRPPETVSFVQPCFTGSTPTCLCQVDPSGNLYIGLPETVLVHVVFSTRPLGA